MDRMWAVALMERQMTCLRLLTREIKEENFIKIWYLLLVSGLDLNGEDDILKRQQVH